ncbi:MAG: hypothetical protein EZS28_001415 [Streblomastix strix]|uniref:Reverse transcriptase domain-containing protein n=1 Tax=Streblomastix strix TaxID=222440 RepID=A0A5J4X777_9EUKA|nr:MAG: hypothetical protein EZS28_001415 [Streblomastix strix]
MLDSYFVAQFSSIGYLRQSGMVPDQSYTTRRSISSYTSGELEEIPEYDCSEQGDLNKSLQDELNRPSGLVNPPHGQFMTFETMRKVSQYRAMSFGTQHCSIFFSQIFAMVLAKIWKRSEIRILNYVDYLLLLYLDIDGL